MDCQCFVSVIFFAHFFILSDFIECVCIVFFVVRLAGAFLRRFAFFVVYIRLIHIRLAMERRAAFLPISFSAVFRGINWVFAFIVLIIIILVAFEIFFGMSTKILKIFPFILNSFEKFL